MMRVHFAAGNGGGQPVVWRSIFLVVLSLVLATAQISGAEPAEVATDEAVKDAVEKAGDVAEAAKQAATDAVTDAAGDAAADKTDDGKAAGEGDKPAKTYTDPKRYVIGNEYAEVSISDWRGSIGHMKLKGVQPLPLPAWRGVPNRSKDEIAALKDPGVHVIDTFNQVDFNKGWSNTDMTSFVDQMSLFLDVRSDGIYGPLEDAWQDVEYDAAAGTVKLHFYHDEYGLDYTMRIRMANDSPTVLYEFEIINKGKEPRELAPRLVALNGVYQDDPAGEGYDLAVVAGFGGTIDGFTYWGMPDPSRYNNKLEPVEIRHPDTDAIQHSPSQLDYIGLKSRFFASLWRPGSLQISEAPKAGTEPQDAGMRKLNSSEDPDGQVAQTSDNFLIQANAFGYRQILGSDESQQAAIWVNFRSPTGGSFTLAPGDKMTVDWSISGISLRQEHLDLLPEHEQQIQYADWYYRFFRILVAPLSWLLSFLASILHWYALALIALVLIIKGLLHKINVKTQTSMMKMQKLGPQLKNLQDKYKNDRQTMAMKQMELFKKEGVNPVGGCLPLLLQMPIFIALYQTFRHSADMRGQGFLWVPDLTLPDQTFHLFGPITLNLLPLLYIGVSMLISFSSKVPQGGQVSDQARQMQMMMRWLPVLFGIIFYNMPSGLVLYFTISAVVGFMEMRYIRKKLGMDGVGMPTM